MPNPNSSSTGPDPRKTNRRDATGSVERLLDGAQAVFAEHGYRAANVNEICARSKVGIGTFYAHFDHKRQLLKKMFIERAVLLSRILAPADLLDHERLVKCLRTVVDEPIAAGMLRAWYEAVLEEPEIAHFHAEWRASTVKDLAATVEAAQDLAPTKATRLDPETVAWAMGTLSREVAIHDRHGAPDVEGLARLFEELVFGAVTT